MLDGEIRKFLHLLSSYLLLKPSIKAFEWLLYRFKVQNMFAQEIIFCALPYHETPLFKKLLGILKIPKEWLALENYGKTSDVMSRSDLVDLMEKNKSFCSLFCKHCTKIEDPGLLTFYMSILCVFLSKIRVVDQNLAVQVLDVVFAWLKSDKEHQIGAIAIASALVDRASLSENVLHGIIDHLSSLDDNLVLLFVAKICQTQEGLTRLPVSFVDNWKEKDVNGFVERYSKKYDMRRLVKLLVDDSNHLSEQLSSGVKWKVPFEAHLRPETQDFNEGLSVYLLERYTMMDDSSKVWMLDLISCVMESRTLEANEKALLKKILGENTVTVQSALLKNFKKLVRGDTSLAFEALTSLFMLNDISTENKQKALSVALAHCAEVSKLDVANNLDLLKFVESVLFVSADIAKVVLRELAHHGITFSNISFVASSYDNPYNQLFELLKQFSESACLQEVLGRLSKSSGLYGLLLLASLNVGTQKTGLNTNYFQYVLSSQLNYQVLNDCLKSLALDKNCFSAGFESNFPSWVLYKLMETLKEEFMKSKGNINNARHQSFVPLCAAVGICLQTEHGTTFLGHWFERDSALSGEFFAMFFNNAKSFGAAFVMSVCKNIVVHSDIDERTQENLARAALVALSSETECIREKAVGVLSTLSLCSSSPSKDLANNLLEKREKLLSNPASLPQILSKFVKKISKDMRVKFFDIVIPKSHDEFGIKELLWIIELSKSSEKTKNLLALANSVVSETATDDSVVIGLVANFIKEGTLTGESEKDVKAFVTRVAVSYCNSDAVIQALISRLTKIWNSVDQKFKIELIEVAIGLGNSSGNALLLQLPLVVEEFDYFITAKLQKKSQQKPVNSKKAKLMDNEKTDDFVFLVQFLEVILQKTSAKGTSFLSLSVLFKIIEFVTEKPASGVAKFPDYVLQLALGLISQEVLSSKVPVKSSKMRVDLIVKCLRLSKNPQTKSEIIRVVAEISKMNPEPVLHNIMPIITFMGSDMLHKDDNHSFAVIGQLVRNVVPKLGASKAQNNLDEGVPVIKDKLKMLLSVFVHAYDHIPAHRRRPVYTDLVNALVPRKYLAAVIALLLGNGIKGKRQDAVITEFCVDLILQFSAHEILCCCSQGLEVSENLLLGKENLVSNVLDTEVDQNDRSSFVKQFLTVMHTVFLKMEGLDAMQEQLKHILKRLASFLHLIPCAQVKKCLEVVSSFATSNSLVDCTASFLESKEYTEALQVLRSRASWLLKQRSVEDLEVEQISNSLLDLSLASRDRALVIEIMTTLSTFWTPNCPAAVVKSLKFKNLVKFVDEHEKDALLLHGFAKLVDTTVEYSKHQILPVFNDVTKILLCGLPSDYPSETRIACMSGLNAIVRTLSNFLGKNLDSILSACISLKSEINGNPAIKNAAEQLHNSLIECLEPKQIIKKIVDDGKKPSTFSIIPVSEIILECLSKSTRSDIDAVYVTLFNYVLNGLDSCASEDVHHYTKIGSSLCLKLNEAKFNPLFSRFVSWGSEKKERMCAFVAFLSSLFDDFKDILVPYYASCHKMVLNCLSYEKFKDGMEWTQCIDLISKSLKFDSVSFYTEPNWTELAERVIEQLKIFSRQDMGLLEPLKACMVELAAIGKRENSLKVMNSLLLKMATHDSAKVRLAAVSCMEAAYTEYGNDFVLYLPETITYLNELLEDDSDAVEKASRRLIEIIEEHIGEKIEKYLS